MDNVITYIVSFDSTSHAIRAEKLLKEHFNIETIGTPGEITHNCGLSIILHCSDLESITNILGTLKVQCTLYAISGDKKDGSRLVKKVYSTP